MRTWILLLALFVASGPRSALAQAQPPVWVDDEASADDDQRSALGVVDEDPEPTVGDDQAVGDEDDAEDPYPEKIDPTVFTADGAEQPPPPPPPVLDRPAPPPPVKGKPDASSAGMDPVPPTPRPGTGDKSPDTSDKPGSFEESIRAVSFGEVERAGDLRGQFLEMWHERRLALARGDNLAAANQLNALIAQFRRYGGEGPLASSARDIGSALAREARTALAEKDTRRAVALADNAALLAPDQAPVFLTLARVRLAHAPLDLKGQVSALRGALLAIRGDLGVLIGFALLALALLFVVALAAPMLASLVLLLRCGRLLGHDLRHLLPRGVSTLQSLLLVLLLAVLPVLLKLGPQLGVLWWLLMIWAYLTRRERAAMLGLWLITVLAPISLIAATHLLSPEARDASQLFALSRDLGTRDAKGQLVALLQEHPDDAAVLGTLGVLHKRDGELEEARTRLNQAIAKEPDWAWLHNNLGNVRVLESDIDGGLAEYQRAVDLEPTLLEAHFNIANLYFRQRKMVQAKEASAAALNLDATRFAAFKEMADTAPSRIHNRAVVDINLPLAVAAARLLEEPASKARIEREVGRILFFGLAPGAAIGVSVGGFVLLLVLGLLIPRLKPAHPCPRCGQAACARCDADLPRHDVCAQCFHAFLAPAKNIDANLKIRKEIEVRRHKARGDNVRRLLSALLAGSGHLVAGAPVRGVIGVVLFVTIVSAIFFLGGVVPMPFAVSAGWPLVRTVVLVVLFLLLAVWAVFSASRLED
ncbi:MAG: tetratricopeptide repeat protein [Pseudomonadota bacterium]